VDKKQNTEVSGVDFSGYNLNFVALVVTGRAKISQ